MRSWFKPYRVPTKNMNMAAYSPVIPAYRKVDIGVSLGLVGYQPSSRFSEKRCLKGINKSAIEQNFLSFPVFHMSIVHTHINK